MSVLVGPLFSLSASGLLGKALFYYDTKYGARVRVPKKSFVPPGAIWEVNKEWFKAASDRWKKVLTNPMKWAWKLAYSGKCDTARDIFMGQQIELWNLSPLNNLTWPTKGVAPVGEFYIDYDEYVGEINCWFRSPESMNTPTPTRESWVKIKQYCSSSVWANKLDNSNPPSEEEITKEKQGWQYKFALETGHVNYLWGGLRYYNGNIEWRFIGSFVR